MAWTTTREDLERARDALRTRVDDDPWWGPLEQLARAHRWLGEEDEAARRFREAAADLEDVLRGHGREDTYNMGQIASMLVLAGDPEAARPWIERALRGESNPSVVAGLHYLAGDFDAAATVARRAADDPDDRPYPWAEALEALAVARRDGDSDRAATARETFADLVREDGTPPYEESGSANLSLSDWLREAFRAEADLRGEPVPDKDEMLRRAGG